MTERLNVLMVEDSEADVLLVERSLAQHGLSARCRMVSRLEQLAAELDRGPWDVLLADYTVPQLDFFDGLALVQSRLPDLPVIVVSGTIGEERAVELLRAGVADVVLKDSLVRIGPAIERSIREAAERRAARAAERDLRLLNVALNAAADAVLITDRDGSIVWVNPAFTALTGYTAAEAIGKNPRALVKSGAHPPEFYADLWNTILAGQPWRGEITNRRKDGRLYPEEQSITPVTAPSGEITHLVAIKRDVSVERQLREQFLQAQKTETVGRLAGGIAHDFNNLITVINGTADLASLKLSASDPLLQDLDRIRETGERAAALTRQLLAFSRKQIVKPEVVDLGAVLAEVEHMLRRLLGEDVELRLTRPEAPALVLADRGQIEQVVMNLVVNARDAMPAGGSLTLEVSQIVPGESDREACPTLGPGPHVVLTVQDTGVGMDEATKARIFEPFFTTKEPGRGTGIGLATVYGIVGVSGGCIRVWSEPGKGTTFGVYLPAAEAAAPPRPPETDRSVARGHETILVVEDEPTLRKLARRMLVMAGYEVLAAGGGDEAMRLLERHDGPVHLVLTDVVMPGISGRELAEHLLDVRPGLKVVYTSGYTDDVVLRHGLADRATRFVAKPYTMEELTREIRRALDD